MDEIYVKQRDGLQKALTEFYRCNYRMISVSSIQEDLETDVIDVYVRPPIEAFDPKELYRLHRGTATGTQVTSYKQMLFHEDGRRNKNIYLISKPGTGKTTFCIHLSAVWCQAHNPDESAAEQFNDDDIQALRQYQLAFFIVLREVQEFIGLREQSLCDVDEMVTSFISSRLTVDVCPTLLKKMLVEESCLIVLDGLDEWNHPKPCKVEREPRDIPHQKLHNNYTVLTTTRSWKLDVIRLKPSEYDRRLDIHELDDPRLTELQTKAVKVLNRIYGEIKTSDAFSRVMAKINLGEIRHTPYVHLQCLCLWYNNEEIGKSKCQIYANLMEATLERQKNKFQSEFLKRIDEAGGVPLCFKHNKYCNQHMALLRTLGKMACHCILNKENRQLLVMDLDVVSKYLTKEELKYCLKLGLLTQNKDYGKVSTRVSNVSFAHKTVHEFYCALYLQSTGTTSSRPGSDVTSSRHGSDVTSSHPGSDVTSSRPGSDVTSSRPGSDVTSSRPRSDVASSRPRSDVASSRPRSDVASSRPRSDVACSRPRSDVACSRPRSDVASSRPRSDVASSRPRSDVASSRPGSDVTSSRPGSDVTSSRPGSDVTSSRPGSDVTSSGPGSDVISSHPGSDVTSSRPGSDVTSSLPGSDVTSSSSERETVQNVIVDVCSDLSKILEMSAVLIFLSGLDSQQCSQILKTLSTVVTRDSTCKAYRARADLLDYHDEYKTMFNFQTLLTDCACEMKLNDEEVQSLPSEDIMINKRSKDAEYVSLLQSILQTSETNMKTLDIKKCVDTTEVTQIFDMLDLRSLSSLEKLVLNAVAREQDVQQLLQQSTDTLRALCLRYVNYDENTDGYTECMTVLSEQCTDMILSMQLLQAVHLQNLLLSHDQWERIVAFITSRTKMTQVRLVDITCRDHEESCPGVMIDLSRHENLELLGLDDVPVSQLEVNSQILEECFIGDLPSSVISSWLQSLPAAQNLHILTCHNLSEDDTRIMIEAIPALLYLTTLYVYGTNLGDRRLRVSRDMTKLESIGLWEVTLTSESLRDLVDTVSHLAQSVSVELSDCTVLPEDEYQAIKQEISQSDRYSVMEDRPDEYGRNVFYFRTVNETEEDE